MPKQSFNVELNISAKGTKLPSNGRIRADFGNPDSGSDSDSDSDVRSSRASSAVPPTRRPGRPMPHMFVHSGPGGPGSGMPPPPPPPVWVSSPPRRCPKDSDTESNFDSDSSDSDYFLDETKAKKGSKPKKAKKKTSKLPIGSVSEIKNLYMSPKDRDGNFTVSSPSSHPSIISL